jgi:hypothetical protein
MREELSEEAVRALGNNRFIIIISGKKRSGKDTLCKALIKELKRCTVVHARRFAFADSLRRMLEVSDPMISIGSRTYRRYTTLLESFGYEKAKEQFPQIRQFMQRLGDAVREWYPDFFVDTTVREIEDYFRRSGGAAIITDARYQNEEDYIRQAFPNLTIFHVRTSMIGRPDEKKDPHASEAWEPKADMGITTDYNRQAGEIPVQTQRRAREVLHKIAQLMKVEGGLLQYKVPISN